MTAGALVAVFGTPVDSGGGYVALEFRFAQGSLRLTCDDDTDEVVVEMRGTGPLPAQEDLSADDLFAPMVGKDLEYVWWLTNHRGYEDGLQMRLLDLSHRTEVTAQFEVAASVLVAANRPGRSGGTRKRFSREPSQERTYTRRS